MTLYEEREQLYKELEEMTAKGASSYELAEIADRIRIVENEVKDAEKTAESDEYDRKTHPFM